MADLQNNPIQVVNEKPKENIKSPCQEVTQKENPESKACKIMENKEPEDSVMNEQAKSQKVDVATTKTQSACASTEKMVGVTTETKAEQNENKANLTENAMANGTDGNLQADATSMDNNFKQNSTDETSIVEPGDMDLVDQVDDKIGSKDAANSNDKKDDIITLDEGNSKKGAEFINSHYDENSQTDATDAPMVSGTEGELDESTNSVEGATSSNTQTDQAMSLDKIKSMIDTINSDISTLRKSSDSNNDEANVPAESKSGEGGIDFDSLRMRNDMLRQELLSIKISQESRMHVDTVAGAEMKIIESTKKNKLKDCTKSLEEEIQLITKARRAQASLKKKQDERKEAEVKRKQAGPGGQSGPDTPVTNADIRTSIKLLKDELEHLSNLPVGEIVPDSTGEESNKSSIEPSETNPDAEQEKSTKNKKAHDDLLKKYLMMNVMRQNVQMLTDKVNTMMTSQGIKSVTEEEKQKSVETKKNDNVDGTDDYFLYNDDDGENSDLYEEDETTETDVKEKKESLQEAAAKSISKVEAVIYKDKASSDSTSAVSDTSNAHLSKSQKKKIRKRQQAQGTVKNDEAKTKQDIAKSDKDKDMNDQDKEEETVMSPERIRSYNLLLKLQRDMTGMQIQVSKLQDHMRAANASLKEIMDTEFANV